MYNDGQWFNDEDVLGPLRQTRADAHAFMCQNSSTTFCCSVSSNQVELTWWQACACKRSGRDFIKMISR